MRVHVIRPGLPPAILVPTDKALSSEQIVFEGSLQLDGSVTIREFQDTVPWVITTAIPPVLFSDVLLVEE